MSTTFDPQTLADDLCKVQRIYAGFFATLDQTRWDTPVKRGRTEWTLHETVAHLCALNGAGLESIEHTLRSEPYTFIGLDNVMWRSPRKCRLRAKVSLNIPGW